LPDGLTETTLQHALAEALQQTPPTSAEVEALPADRRQLVETLDQLEKAGLKIYTYLIYGLTAVLVGAAVYCAIIATPANGLMVVAIVLFGLAGLVFTKMESFLHSMSRPRMDLPSIRIAENVIVSKPNIIKLDQAEISTARELKKTGKDLDSICRAVEPNYAGWGSLQEMLFR
jgi:hypothetical protein